jgi:two-component system response regulator AtoC
MQERILVVDDDADHRGVLTAKLEHSGYTVREAGSAEEALAVVSAFDPALIITDLRMPGMTGVQLTERVRSATEGIDVVVVTAHEDMGSAVAAMKAGAFDYLVKPIQISTIDGLVERCLREQALNREAGSPRVDELSAAGDGEVVGRDPHMIEIYKMIGVLARNRATVLVRGETGTGKELVARAIHDYSAHSDQPFIAVNCTALTDTLLESELFGHAKGAFTGAVSSRRGYFELAGSGTIFLDEIGDTSPGFQTKLLRVLQDRTFYPVGGESPRSTEARVIAATHQPIEELVRGGKFREDLYFRLKVVEIRVPALREREGDIPLLANALLERIRRETDSEVHQISPEAMVRLRSYRWPGNVRELENTLTRAAILARGSTIGAGHVSLGPAGAPEPRPAEATPSTWGPGDDGDPTALMLETAILEHVRRVLAITGGNKSEAARLMRISRSRLNRILRKTEGGETDDDPDEG